MQVYTCYCKMFSEAIFCGHSVYDMMLCLCG